MSENGCLIVGLGNPGAKYENTRHNAGFLVLDHYASSIGASISLNKYKGDYCRSRVKDVSVILLKPQTYMNLSGESVVRFQDYFQVEFDRILVIHDDLDLEPGRLKVVAKGGAGGHNGIRSIIQHLGTQNFARIKIGIGKPKSENGRPAMPVEHFVLAPFSVDEQQALDDRMQMIADAVDAFIDHGVREAMNRINGKT